MNIEIEDVTLYVAIHGVCKEINMIKNNYLDILIDEDSDVNRLYTYIFIIFTENIFSETGSL